MLSTTDLKRSQYSLIMKLSSIDVIFSFTAKKSAKKGANERGSMKRSANDGDKGEGAEKIC